MSVEITIERADGLKCARCWLYREDVGKGPEPFKDICNRCFLVMEDLFRRGKLKQFCKENAVPEETVAKAFSYLKSVGVA